MKKSFQGFVAIIAIILFGWGIYYATVPSPQEDPAASLTSSTPALTNKTVRNEESELSLISDSKQKPTSATSSAPSGEMHLAQPHNFNGKIPVPESEPINLSSQNMSMKKEETKSKEILPGVTIRGGGVNVNLNKDDSRTLEVRPRSQTQLTLKQKF